MKLRNVVTTALFPLVMAMPAQADDAQDYLQQLEDIYANGLIDLGDADRTTCANFTGEWSGQCAVEIVDSKQSLFATTDKSITIQQDSCKTLILSDREFTLDVAKNKTLNSAQGFQHIAEALYWMEDGNALGYAKSIEGMGYAEGSSYKSFDKNFELRPGEVEGTAVLKSMVKVKSAGETEGSYSKTKYLFNCELGLAASGN